MRLQIYAVSETSLPLQIPTEEHLVLVESIDAECFLHIAGINVKNVQSYTYLDTKPSTISAHDRYSAIYSLGNLHRQFTDSASRSHSFTRDEIESTLRIFALAYKLLSSFSTHVRFGWVADGKRLEGKTDGSH